MPRKTQEEQAHITRLWYDHAFEWPKEIARLACLQGVKCSSPTALKLYPFERPTGHIRQDQAIRALAIYPDLTAKALERMVHISDNTIGKAKRFLDKVKLFLDGGIHRAAPFYSAVVTPDEAAGPAPSLVTEHVAEHVVEHVVEHIAEPPPLEDTNIGDVLRQRGVVYGHPLDNFHNIAKGSEIISQCADPEVRVALNLIWVKVCRLIKSPDHFDSIHDIAGYAGTIEMLHMERKRRSQ